MEPADLPDDYNIFGIVYCDHPDTPYAHIQLEQDTKIIITKFQE